MPIEMVEVDIRDSWEKLGEITGDTVRRYYKNHIS